MPVSQRNLSLKIEFSRPDNCEFSQKRERKNVGVTCRRLGHVMTWKKTNKLISLSTRRPRRDTSSNDISTNDINTKRTLSTGIAVRSKQSVQIRRNFATLEIFSGFI